MNDPDLDSFAALWNEPDEAEQAEFEAMARRVRRQGRLLAYGDVAFVAIIVVGLLLGVMMTPSPLMMAIAVVMVVVTMLITWKRRQIRQISRTLNTRDRRAFLESSIRNANANLRRATLSLLFLPLGVAAAVVFKIAWRNEGRIDDPFDALAQWGGSTRGLITLTIMALISALLIRSRLKIRAELRRLGDLRAAYAEEANRDEADVA